MDSKASQGCKQVSQRNAIGQKLTDLAWQGERMYAGLAGGVLVNAYLKIRQRRIQRFLNATANSPAVQKDVLLKKIRRNIESDFGQEHGFGQIRTIADFRNQVPIGDYEHYRPFIDRVKQGEVQAMFGPNTKVLMFALSSGTTQEAKHLPITREFFQEYRRGWDLWGVQAYWDHPTIRTSNMVQLTSDWQQYQTPGQIPCGNISGFARDSASFVARWLYALPGILMKIRDPEAKLYTALRLTIDGMRIGLLITANPSTLVNLAKLADQHRETLVRDIHNGTLASSFDIPQEIRQALQWRTRRPLPWRAKQLEREIESTGHLYPRDFWKDLGVIGVWSGGTVGAYHEQLRNYYGNVAFRDHGLHASEGRMTIPLEDGTSSGILDILNNYFEFIPEEEYGSRQPTVLEGHELEVGKNYYILLSTSGGLYRYDIQDVVRCDGFQGQAPMLSFLNKGAYISSITGEKLSGFQIVEAIRKGFKEFNFPLELFTMAPEWGDPPGYVLLLEPGFPQSSYSHLAETIDQHLSKLNVEYEDRLNTNRLRPLRIEEVPEGTWNSMREGKLRQKGGSLEQYKHPCLATSLDFLDSIQGQSLSTQTYQ
ncbi:GH3 auxin-responsive promoter [Planctomycetales bacterium 10988]|nr:GH3 auxin-responsive promoter [Planctomycetales bacterium 10988]